MKRILLAGLAVILVGASTASAMVTISKHNFSNGNANGQAVYLTTAGSGNEAAGEVCVFCHTPHGAATDAPLWNRKLATAGSYTPYNSSTIDAAGARGDRQPQGISLACLSCHDGTIAIDSLRNAPGSGNYDATAASRTWVWTGLAGDNTLPEDGRITNLTQDLRTQHPISIEYARYGAVNYDAMFYQPNATHSSGAMYFDDGDSIMEDNEVRLYLISGTAKVSVECASCHNPHGTESGVGVNIPLFLRKSNSQSALCTTCHIK